MEGLYLHNLIFRALFADSDRNILRYIIMGWGNKIVIKARRLQKKTILYFRFPFDCGECMGCCKIIGRQRILLDYN